MFSCLALQHRARFVKRYSLLGRGAAAGGGGTDGGVVSPASASNRSRSASKAQMSRSAARPVVGPADGSSRLSKLTAINTSHAAANPTHVRRHDQKSSCQI